jgi:hypothetical protein
LLNLRFFVDVVPTRLFVYVFLCFYFFKLCINFIRLLQFYHWDLLNFAKAINITADRIQGLKVPGLQKCCVLSRLFFLVAYAPLRVFICFIISAISLAGLSFPNFQTFKCVSCRSVWWLSSACRCKASAVSLQTSRKDLSSSLHFIYFASE